MLDHNSTQQAIVASDYKKVSWLFKVVDSAGPTTYYWSTVTRNYGGNSYTFKIIPSSFDSITLNRNKSEINIQAPNDLSFDVSNKDNVLTASNFKNGSVTVYLVISDGTDEEIICTWKFNIKQCEPGDQKLHFVCQDFIQPYLEGDYPNQLVSDLLLYTDMDFDDNVCVPVLFGECYVPLRPLYLENDFYYLLGPSGEIYDIEAVRSPREMGSKAEYSGEYNWSGEYYEWNFPQSVKTFGGADWNVFQPIIAKSTPGGVVDSCGIWKPGDYPLDMPTRFSRSDTASKSNPAHVIEFVLKDFGVPSEEFDIGVGSSFETASGEFAAWNLKFNGAYWFKQSRQKVLSQLLSMCHSTLRLTDKIELHVLSKQSQKTITNADILRTQEIGEGTFERTVATQEQYDSGYVAFQEVNESQDELLKAPVSVKNTFNNTSSDVLEIPFVQDSQNVQRIGTLRCQRKFLREGDDSFRSKGTLLAIQPDDIVTVSGEAYGGTHNVLVDQIEIGRDVSIAFQCVRFSDDLDDWEDLSPEPIAIASGEAGTFWGPVISGPDGKPAVGNASSILTGFLIVGTTENRIIVNPTVPHIKVDENGIDRIMIGKLEADQYGIRGNDAAGNLIFKIDSAEAELAGWSFDATKLSADSGNIVLNSVIPYIGLGAATDYLTGIGIWHGKHDGIYKMHMGNPAGDHIKWDGSDLTIVGGMFIGGSNIGSTISNTFEINSDDDDVSVQLIFGRTTGGNAIMSWNGSLIQTDKNFKPLQFGINQISDTAPSPTFSGQVWLDIS